MIKTAIIGLLLNEPTVVAHVVDRIYPTQAPDAPTYPLIVVHKITGMGSYDMQGDAGLEDAIVQINIMTDLGEEHAVIVKQAVRRFLSGFRGGGQASGDACAIDCCMCIRDTELPQVATERAGPRIRSRMLEFRVWNTEI